MPLQAAEPRRLYRHIAAQLRLLIQRGDYAVGTRLPAERELASRLEVSRPSVREALIALEVEGFVEVRPGSGIHVIAHKRAASARRIAASTFGPFEVIRARQLIEGELAALAAERADKAQVAALRESIAAMKRDIAAAVAPVRGDRLFHIGIAQAADNGPLLRTVAELFDERHNPVFEQLGQHFENGRSWRKAVLEHQAVVAAIAKGDADAARLAMHLHLQHSQDRLAQAWPQPAAASALLS
jgi:GntR family transcriptional regulator, transcriptional repressor for pyruvate dehydrogenase complex